MSAPILLLVFNRPDLTAQVFARIKDARPPKLFVAADGPRHAKAGETRQCELSRAATENIDWPCEVHRLYQTENLGCKLAVSGAVTWFFQHVESGIILEDDCLPEQSFFLFCSELLTRYQDYAQVGIISGANFQSSAYRAAASDSYYFSTYSHIWGWATWRRVWDHYDANLAGWSGNLESHAAEIPIRRVRETLSTWMRNSQTGETNTWDYQLLNLLIARRQFAVIPWTNLVTNIGFDDRATHTTGATSGLSASAEIPFPLIHPPQVEINQLADRYTESVVFGIAPNLANHLCRRFWRLLRRMATELKLISKKVPQKKSQYPTP